MIAKRLGSCRLAQSVTTLFLSGDTRRVSSGESAIVKRGHCSIGSFSQAGPFHQSLSSRSAAAAELISRIVRGGTMPPLRRLSPAEDLLNAVRHERFPPSWVASDPTENNRTVAPTGGSARHVECSHQFEPWEAQSLDRSDAGLGKTESHLLGPVHGLRHQ
ncbi:hypothetical protein T06_15912, partial [Trichinella sp. T6]